MSRDVRSSIMKENLLNSYKSTALRNKVLEIYGLIDYCLMLDENIVPPHITQSYKVMYSQRVTVNSSKLENYVIKKIMIELNKNYTFRNKLLTKISLSLKKLSELELQVFKLSVYEGKSEELIAEEMNYCIDTIRKIKKSSFARFLISLGLDHDCFN
ncbi:MAG: hypothetical protein RSH78_01355 [Bacilli bacterium]